MLTSVGGRCKEAVGEKRQLVALTSVDFYPHTPTDYSQPSALGVIVKSTVQLYISLCPFGVYSTILQENCTFAHKKYDDDFLVGCSRKTYDDIVADAYGNKPGMSTHSSGGGARGIHNKYN